MPLYLGAGEGAVCHSGSTFRGVSEPIVIPSTSARVVIKQDCWTVWPEHGAMPWHDAQSACMAVLLGVSCMSL